MKIVQSVALLASILLLAACGGSGSTSAGAPSPSDQADGKSAVTDVQLAADTGSSQQTDASAGSPDVPTTIAYPKGPYGNKVGDTVGDLDFYDPKTEKSYFLYDWYQHPKVKMLMLISTALW